MVSPSRIMGKVKAASNCLGRAVLEAESAFLPELNVRKGGLCTCTLR
jgi:hypothetical protein